MGFGTPRSVALSVFVVSCQSSKVLFWEHAAVFSNMTIDMYVLICMVMSGFGRP